MNSHLTCSAKYTELALCDSQKLFCSLAKWRPFVITQKTAFLIPITAALFCSNLQSPSLLSRTSHEVINSIDISSLKIWEAPGRSCIDFTADISARAPLCSSRRNRGDALHTNLNFLSFSSCMVSACVCPHVPTWKPDVIPLPLCTFEKGFLMGWTRLASSELWHPLVLPSSSGISGVPCFL